MGERLRPLTSVTSSHYRARALHRPGALTATTFRSRMWATLRAASNERLHVVFVATEVAPW